MCRARDEGRGGAEGSGVEDASSGRKQAAEKADDREGKKGSGRKGKQGGASLAASWKRCGFWGGRCCLQGNLAGYAEEGARGETGRTSGRKWAMGKADGSE